MAELMRLVEWTAAYDRRHPEPSKNYGIHGMEVKFLLKGPRAVTQFVIYTNWHLQSVQREMDAKGFRTHRCHAKIKQDGDVVASQDADFELTVVENPNFVHIACHPLPADMGYHSLTPIYEGQDAITDSCPYLDGKPCYYDGSGLQAEELYWKFVEEGDGIVWKELERRYNDIVPKGDPA